MKNKILLLLVSFCVFQSNGQDLLKEITKTFENGKPMFIDYLEMEDLKKVKTEIFNESGTLIFSVQFNKDTGKYDGEFYDLINKGYFKDGVLNCNNCMLVEANKPSVYTYNHDRQNTLVTKGNVVNGRLTGKVERYTLHEGTYSKIDWESTRKYVAAGAGSGFRDVKTYRTGQFNKTQLPTFNYNSNGVLDGEQIFKYKNGEMSRLKLNFENGIVTSKVSYDKNNLIIDSLFNENKIWKINKKFVKNNGFIVFSGLKYRKNSFEGYIDYKITNSSIVMIGGVQNIDGGCIPQINRKEEYKNNFFDTGGIKWGLNTDGLYSGFSQTGSNYTKTTEKDPEWNNIGLHKGVYVGSRVAFVSVLYNLLINDIIKDPVFGGGWGEEFYLFFNELNQKYEGNYFKQFLKVKSFRELYKRLRIRQLDLMQVNDHVISFSNYLKGYKESLKKDFKEISEVLVYNQKSSKYDKVDFDKLIELSIEKEAKAKVEAKLNVEAETKEPIENLELWYSSEKSSDFYLKQFSKQLKDLNSYYSLNLFKIEIHRVPGNKDATEAFTFYYFKDLNGLKKLEQLSSENKSVNLYHKDENNLILVYNAKK